MAIPVEIANQIELLRALFNAPIDIIEEEEVEDGIITRNGHFSNFSAAARYLNKLGIKYKQGKVVLSEREQELFDIIFSGREEQFKHNYIVGEAIHFIQLARDRGTIEQEFLWWE